MIPTRKTEEKDKKNSENRQKWLIMGQNWPILPPDTPRKPNLLIFPGVQVLLHTRRHLEEGFRKFSAKSNDKIQSYKQKTSKKWPFGPKTPILNPPGGQKAVKMNFREKSENVMFLHSLRLSYMQKIRKF